MTTTSAPAGTDAPAAPPARRPAADGTARRARRTVDRWCLVPLVAAVLLLALPVREGSGGVPPADLASGVLVLCAVGRALALKARPLPAGAAAVVCLPVVGLAVATVTAADPAAALPGFVRYLQIFVLVPLAVCLLVREASGFRVAIGAFVLLALVQGAIGVHQYLTGTGASYRGEEIRAVGTFGPGDVMGMATVVAYGLLAVLPYALRTAPGAPVWLRPCALAATGVLFLALALSFSRGSWIATSAAVLVVVLLTGARRAARTLGTLVALGVVLVGGFGVGSALVSERLSSVTHVASAPDRSVNDRYTLWAAAGRVWREHPVTGVGLKGFPAHRDGHASIGLSSGSDTAGAGQQFRRQELLSPHNMYLLVLAEQGLIGFVALVGSWLAVLAGAVCALVRARSRGGPAVDCGLAAVGLMTWQTVDFLYADIGGPSTVLTAVVCGLAARWALSGAERPAAA
ncbi:O-antigen ligase [uncultured Streptomyces sp.]|uniref:O-antigen ligase family protein n=1 Tax=uncultured Streptomyces sp. TaxID=174707 RepID=UPI002617348F|nr:O-antigen ligase family protein [uncultured Streptomyces sp.]